MKEKIKAIPKSIFLYFIFALLMMITISLKTNYYIDEVYSYGLSNDTGEGIDIEIEYNKTYTPGALAFIDYVAVQNGERFDYSSVWQNQENDVHPPLYYAVLHTISSVFPNRFSRWFAGIINIVSALLVLFVLRRMIPLLTDSKYILNILSVSFIFMTGMLLAAAYFRMYLMAMLWVTLLTYWFMRQVDKKQDFKFYGLVYCVTVAGALIHYYVIVYAVLISCVYGVYLLWNKRIKETLLFCVTMLAAGGTAIAVFPAMIQHMFFGYRGTEAIDNLAGKSDYWENFKEFYNIIDCQMFGKNLGYILVGLILLTAIRYSKNHLGLLDGNKAEKVSFGLDRKTVIRYLLALIPCFSYFMLVTKMTFTSADRYILPIYAVLWGGILCMTLTIIKHLIEKRTFMIISVAMAALIVVGSYQNTRWEYLYRESKPFLEKVEEYRNLDCICVLNGKSYMLYPEFAEYINYKSITFITPEELKENGINQWITTNGVVVSFIENKDTGEYLQKVMEENGYSGYEELGGFGYDRTYYLHY